jgi:hypothetical protein
VKLIVENLEIAQELYQELWKNLGTLLKEQLPPGAAGMTTI